jgi:LysR family glycine cleavage system transcriptional activator
MLNKRYLPSITALQCFEAVTRHLSFTRAAEELNLTQSAVSKQVAQLEELLQHLLFRRVRRRLQMTPAGDLYLVEVRKILTQVEMSTHYLRSYGGETEVLRVSTPPTFGARWLVLCSEQEADDLLQGRSDLAFYFGQGSRPRSECLKLFGEELVPVCSPASLPAKPFTDPTQLTELVLLQNASRPQAWHDWFDSQGYHTEHSYHGPRFETFYMCIRAAQVGCGVALLPRFLVEEELADGKLVIPWQHAMPSSDAYYLAYPEHSAEVPKVRDFVQWMLEQIDSPIT